MGLRVLTRSSVSTLVALAALKTELGVSGTSLDAQLTRILSRVGDEFAQYIGWPLLRQQYLYTVAGNGRHRLLLPARPVDPGSVSIEIDEVALVLADEEYAVEDGEQGILFRSLGWNISPAIAGEDGEANVAVTFKAGWVASEVISAWTALDATIANATTKWIRPSSPQLSPYLFEVTTAGTLGATEPTWPSAADTAVPSGTAVLTSRVAAELPPALYEAAMAEAISVYEGSRAAVPVGIASEREGSVELSYSTSAAAASSPLSIASRSVLEAYR